MQSQSIIQETDQHEKFETKINNYDNYGLTKTPSNHKNSAIKNHRNSSNQASNSFYKFEKHPMGFLETEVKHEPLSTPNKKERFGLEEENNYDQKKIINDKSIEKLKNVGFFLPSPKLFKFDESPSKYLFIS